MKFGGYFISLYKRWIIYIKILLFIATLILEMCTLENLKGKILSLEVLVSLKNLILRKNFLQPYFPILTTYHLSRFKQEYRRNKQIYGIWVAWCTKCALCRLLLEVQTNFNELSWLNSLKQKNYLTLSS
jgi:hypothetical protein